jgi:hypothetical protein
MGKLESPEFIDLHKFLFVKFISAMISSTHAEKIID